MEKVVCGISWRAQSLSAHSVGTLAGLRMSEPSNSIMRFAFRPIIFGVGIAQVRFKEIAVPDPPP